MNLSLNKTTDFSNWMALHNFKNYINDDTILDWLDLYGTKNNFKKDANDKNIPFNNFLQHKNTECKRIIINFISQSFSNAYYVSQDATIEIKYKQTCDCIKQQIPLIINPTLLDFKNKLISTPDLLINKSHVHSIFYNCSKSNEIGEYIPIDITTLKLNTSKTNERIILNSSKSIQLLKLKMIISNLCLLDMLNKINNKNTKTQKKKRFMKNRDTKNSDNIELNNNISYNNISYDNINYDNINYDNINYDNINYNNGYIISGNLYLKEIKNNRFNNESIYLNNKKKKRKRSYNNCPNHNKQTNNYYTINPLYHSQDKTIVHKLFSCINWLDKLRLHGHKWNVSNPSCIELYPTMTNKDDFPWKSTKKQIANNLNEITLLWSCGKNERELAHKNNVKTWQECTSNLLQINNKKNALILNNMININANKYNSSLLFHPNKLKSQLALKCLKTNSVEFYVDFETLHNYDNNCNVIFMIGCLSYYRVNKKSNRYTRNFKTFTATNLNGETEIINNWVMYMHNIQNKFCDINVQPPIYHWSNAEPIVYKNYMEKYKIKNDKIFNLNFCDLLEVFKSEPIVIKGAFSYGLKEISRAMYTHGLINTIWDTKNISDGKIAMFEAWRYYNGFAHDNTMIEIERYNYIDCKVLQEILEYIRKLK